MTQEKLQPLHIIRFSYNWNKKLDCKAFTTIRISNPHKYIEGQEYWIELKKNIISKAVIKSVIHLKLDTINDFIAYLDTGYNAAECIKIISRMYPKIDFNTQSISVILLEQIERVIYKFDPAGIECFEYYEVEPWKI
jgi:hypothetical protein